MNLIQQLEQEEIKRLARNAAELMTLTAALHAGGIQLELLTGPLTGICLLYTSPSPRD